MFDVEGQHPFCCACGVTIPDFDDELCDPEALEQRGPLSEEEQRKASRLFWSGFLRVIIKHDDRKHSLSGISRYLYPWQGGPLDLKEWTKEHPFVVPLDRNEVVTEEDQVIDESWNSKDTRVGIYAANLWDDRNQNLYPHGFPVHAYCWTVIEQIIGSAAEDKLDIFLQTLRERWKENPFEVDSCVYKQQWFGTIAGSGQLIPENLIATADPDNISEIKNIIQSANEELARRSERNKSIRVRNSFDLPFDVQRLIIDCLRPRDARNALEAMGWEVSPLYWQSRTAPIIKYIPEVEHVKLEGIDREFLFQEAEELFETKELPYGLQNRLRIFRILEGTKKMFFSRLTKPEDNLRNC
ncbi:hypothetical protein FQN54_004592 [Arachnomyces sp. PD_36]|nr:hypothetical protein FQN54_004592 [Arachnomyces sp. PD_36]